MTINTVKSLLENTGISIPVEFENQIVSSLAYDSREVIPGSLFIAIMGFATDGHNFVRSALDSGALAVISEKPVPGIDSPAVFVNPNGDNRILLASIAAAFYGNPWNNMKTVGITGTNGKTSTAHILRWILEHKGISTGIMGTVGHTAGGRSIPASVTTPDSLEITKYMREMVSGGDKACVMEVSSHALALQRVRNVRFDVTLFTNISQDHLDFHSNMEDYLKTKKQIFSLTKDSGIRIVGTYAEGWPEINGAVTFGERIEDTYMISDIEVRLSGSSFSLRTPEGDYAVTVKAPGRFNIYNATGAIVAANQIGVSVSDAAAAVCSFPGVPGRMERIDCGQKFLVAVDYAHTPDALERVLRQGAILAENRLIAVFGCGGDRDNRKRPIMGRIAVENADVAIVTSDNPRTEEPASIISEILKGIPAGYKPLVETDRGAAIKKAIEMAGKGDVVIIAGKGHEDYQILGKVKIHFDDREQARNALADRGYKCVL